MAQTKVQITCGSMNDQIEGIHNETPLSVWGKQHGLSENVMIALTNNDVTSINDLKILENDQDIKEFVASLSIQSYIMRRKLINAIKAMQNEEEKEQIKQSCI